MTYDIVEAEDKHIEGMVLRPIDKLEVETCGHNPDTILKEGLDSSTYCKVGVNTITGKADFIFGVAPHPNYFTVGIPWMLATVDMKITTDWLKRCKREIYPEMLKRYCLLKNWVHEDNEDSIAWLKWLGFKMYQVPGDKLIMFIS